ncbi:hypothetical protein J1605_019997 [Eschrichtius robustus]|uniref:Uncharacterized protein n=1 Tax=Eschrichtius robustus TaxID=9764 RepID=A0AB34HH54_ESCRO|nr:hypothetical protein J1605_019997 [Eschrichtius robustus]
MVSVGSPLARIAWHPDLIHEGLWPPSRSPPNAGRLLFSKVKLESLCRGPDEALLTCKHMLQIWKSCYNLTNPSDSGRGSSLLDRTIADRRQLNTITLPDFSDPETGNSPEVYFHGFPSLFSVSSVHATSVAASRVEQALSEVASSLQSSTPKQGPLHPWMTLAQIWLHADAGQRSASYWALDRLTQGPESSSHAFLCGSLEEKLVPSLGPGACPIQSPS